MTQRAPEEMMRLILSRAENDAHIRVVGMEGSRTNQKHGGNSRLSLDV